MTFKIGFVMDSIKTINISKDSSFAMMLSAQQKGWEIFYIELSNLYLEQDQAKASLRKIEVQRDAENWFELFPAEDTPLTEMDAIIMRKDPPVDSEFIYATHILERAEQAGVLVVNRAASLRDCNEKLYATQFPQCCPPVLVSREQSRLKSFCTQHDDVIFKPLDGMGGESIFRVKNGDSNLSVILETLTNHGQEQIMAQRYIPEIKAGDKRILIVNGVPVSHALARIPSKGELRGNLAAGGRGEAVPLTERDRWIVDQVKADLLNKGLLFVGIDVIGDFLTEINVTSPTCIQELDKACNLDIAGDLMSVIETKLSRNK